MSCYIFRCNSFLLYSRNWN
ncbi:hypothetical protein EPUL_006300 [Erysiphe pulchra]|uniref:Uncharacterized protein n=1 Tax=Erysiphe pulchra TaxID=225359 RepID=A0A2S4PIU0_9PEZI|nr:hypothetical protein EPUL_006300 [Erysiphe pulchra]